MRWTQRATAQFRHPLDVMTEEEDPAAAAPAASTASTASTAAAAASGQ